MIKKLFKYFGLFLLTMLFGVLIVYSGLRFFGLGLSFPNEQDSLPIAINTPDKDYSTLPLISGVPKNVIIFNIAGMGLNQILATRYRYYGKYGRLNLERMPSVALINNTPLGPGLVSSPHAAATAMATGQKALNGELSPPGDKIYPTILQKFKNTGKATGIVTNSYITSATTAAFASNVRSRSQQREIARQMIEAKIDFIIGGGNEFYKSGFDAVNSTGIEFAQDNGYTIVNNKEQLNEVKDSLVLGLFDDLYSNRYDTDVYFDSEDPTFKELTGAAIKHLNKNENGFFLLVDDEGTDFGGYSNRANYLTQHLMRIDEAVGIAIKFATANKETLVVVTSETEAGGMVITEGDADLGTMKFSWGSRRHTGQYVPLFAFGPGSSVFTGIIENTDIHVNIAQLMKF